MKPAELERTYRKAQDNDLRWLASQVARLAELKILHDTAPSAGDAEDVARSIQRIANSIKKRFTSRVGNQIILRATTHIGRLPLEW